MPQRLLLFALISGAEWSFASSHIHKGLGAGVLLQIAIASSSFFFALGYATARSLFVRISRELETLPIGWGYLAGHIVVSVIFAGLSALSLGISPSGKTAPAAIAWFASGAVAIALAACAFIPPKLAFGLVRGAGHLWAYAVAVGLVAWKLAVVFPLWNGIQWNPATAFAWKPATDLTFRIVRTLLHLFVSNVSADRATMTLGSKGFSVTILPWCAGFEGTALMLVFSAAWLYFARRELRFPRALVLIPAAMLTIWLANAIRITALILIGIAGAPAVAVGGFHSQAGWIAFNCVALAFVVLTGRIGWFASEKPAPEKPAQQPAPEQAGISRENPTAAYLAPFLMILAAGMISRAAADRFEWLYPLRFAAAAAALWYYRHAYCDLDWRFGWLSGLIGGVVFALWLALDWRGSAPTDNGIAAGLAAWPAWARMQWLVIRTASAVITVPIAEELAFRGFLIRRMISANFESLGFRQYTYFSVALSSVAFGVLHGDRWLAGVVAGLLYAAAFLRRGRIGDAVFAHATTNGLLAVWVLYHGEWGLW